MITFIEFFLFIKEDQVTQKKKKYEFIISTEVKTIKSLCNLSIIISATYMYIYIYVYVYVDL
jgi:hypothetical protein